MPESADEVTTVTDELELDDGCPVYLPHAADESATFATFAGVAGWHVAASLNALQAEYDARFPNRPRGSDGTKGNAAHAGRPSDHNPDYNAPGARKGVVRARDCSTTVVIAADKTAGRKSLTAAEQRAGIADLLATEYKNPVDRIHYIIHRFPGDAHTHIWSRTFQDADGGWTAKVYPLEASMPHDHHFHVSIMHTAAAENDVKPWFTQPEPPKPPVPHSKPDTLFTLLDWNIGIDRPKKPQAKLILASGATIVTLQECGFDEAASLQAALNPNWVWTRSGTRTVFWRKDVWKSVTEREKLLPSRYSPATKSIAIVQLQHVKDKTYVWAASTHFSADVYPGVSAAHMREERVGQALAFVEALKPYHWIIVGADLNASSSLPGQPRAIIKAGGFSYLSDIPGVKSTVDSHPTAAVGVLGTWIDDVMAKGGVTVLSGELIATKASDHNALLARCRINAANQKAV